MSHCFTWDNSTDCTAFNRKSHSLLQGCGLPAGRQQSTSKRGTRGVLPSGNVNGGVEEGSELFSLASDGWEEPRRGLSTCPALIPARQGTARLPEAAVVVMNVWGGNTQPQATEVGPKIQAHLPPHVPKIPGICAQPSAGSIPVNGAHGNGVPLACCIGGWRGPLCLILGHLSHPHSANYSQHRLPHRNLRADRHRDSTEAPGT